MNWVISTMEVSETPSRSYIISNVENSVVRNAEIQNIAARIIDKNRKAKNNNPDEM